MRTNITKRKVRQKNRQGDIFEYDRYFLHYRDPATGKRRQRRFNTRKEAEEARQELIKGADSMKRRKSNKMPTLKEAVDHWLESKEGVIQKGTHHAYTQVAYDYILGPAFKGVQRDKYRYALTRQLPQGVKLVPMLGGNSKIDKISTSEIRMWLKRLQTVTSTYNVKLTKKHLASVFRMIEEDYETRLARMPSGSTAKHRRQRRQLLNEDQVKLVLEEAQRDQKWGVYYAFLFLTGVRPSEMLGLLWSEVDLERGRVLICRTQNQDGSLKAFPKTDAGIREIPLNSLLLSLLKDWKERCPHLMGKLHRVFPAQGHESGKGRLPNAGSDGGLTLNNFRNRVWYPLFDRLSLPRIAPYAARHMTISFLQAQGVEVGLVAKIAGHSSPEVTLKYYTHAVREYGEMMDKLNSAYGLEDQAYVNGSQVQT